MPPGLIWEGKRPTLASVRQKCRSRFGCQYLKDVIQITIEDDPKGHPHLANDIDTNALNRIAETHLGKTILISNRAEWSDERIIEAYRSQYLIEAVFKEMKDRTTGSWWPLNHWTDSKVRVHGLYCSMARTSAIGAVVPYSRWAGEKISLRRLLAELDGIREVVNLYPMKGKTKHQPQQTVLTRLSRRQQRLVEILGLEGKKHHELG